MAISPEPWQFVFYQAMGNLVKWIMANMLHFFVIMCSANGIVHAIDLPCQLFTYSFCPWQTYFLIAIANLHISPWQF